MPTPFPGMDPYLEHPVLWTSIHVRLLVEISNRLAPLLLPRYVATVEERVFVELPQEQRIPDDWIQKTHTEGAGRTAVLDDVQATTPLVVNVEPLEIREPFIEILDLYRDQRVVTVIELVSPGNKRKGPGRESYQEKQRATLASDCHLVEIDLLRRGRHVMSVPPSAVRVRPGPDYLICVNRSPKRNQYELYPVRLRERLPKFQIPLAEPDEDVQLDLQAAVEQVYENGGYMLRVKYEEPCVPRLKPEDQQWAWECWNSYCRSRPDLFPQAK
jgi:hypothetical protein